MAQPQGMRNAPYPYHVSRLHKAIYGLRQAPRAWYQELNTFMLSLLVRGDLLITKITTISRSVREWRHCLVGIKKK